MYKFIDRTHLDLFF